MTRAIDDMQHLQRVHPMTALGAALYYDFRLEDAPQPAEALVDALLADQQQLTQFCVPIAPRKEAPRPLRRDSLFARVSRGELASFIVGTRSQTPDPEAMTIGFVLAPPTAAAKERRAGYRARLDLAFGATALTRRGVSTVVDALDAFASTVAPRAGVVFPAESASFAHAYASGTRGGLTEEQDRRVKDVFYAVYELGDRIRGPEWGTFLARHHVEKLGGRERVERGAGCELAKPLRDGGLYLQVTERLDAPFSLDALAALLAPVR
jgi:hypothetical protein